MEHQTQLTVNRILPTCLGASFFVEPVEEEKEEGQNGEGPQLHVEHQQDVGDERVGALERVLP